MEDWPHAALVDCRGVARAGSGGDRGGAAGRYPGVQLPDRRRTCPTSARARAGRPDELRAGRGRAARRGPPRPDPGRPGERRRPQHRVAEVAGGHGAGSGRRRGACQVGPQRPPDPPPARPCGSCRYAEVRVRRRPPGAGTGQRPGDRGPCRAGHDRQGPAAAGVRHRGRLARGVDRRCRGAARLTVAPAGRDGRGGRRPGPLRRPGDERADGRRDRRRPPGRRHPGRDRRGARLRLPAGAGQLRARRPPPRRADRRGADGHPGDQGCGVRRRLHHGPPPRVAGPRRDRVGARRGRPGSGGAPWGHLPGAARHRPRRRRRRGDDHRGAAAGPGRHEADLDAVPAPVDDRRRHRGAGGRDRAALGRVRGTRRRGGRRGHGGAGDRRRGPGEVRRRLGGGVPPQL